MDVKQLTRIANQSRTAKEIFKHFAERDREPREGVMDLRRVRYGLIEKGVEVVPQEFAEVFRGLEQAGVGRLIKEKGKPARFIWKASMHEVGSLADGEGRHEPVAPTIRSTSTKGQTDIVLMLDSDREAHVSVPSDLTEKELNFIVDKMRNKFRR